MAAEEAVGLGTERRVVVVIGESRDRGSKSKIEEVIKLVRFVLNESTDAGPAVVPIMIEVGNGFVTLGRPPLSSASP